MLGVRSYMDIWVDGDKNFQEHGNSIHYWEKKTGQKTPGLGNMGHAISGARGHEPNWSREGHMFQRATCGQKTHS